MTRMKVCEHCSEGFQVAATGRPPKYCSATCRKAAWEAARFRKAVEEEVRLKVTVAVAKAVAAERRRAAIRGNETPFRQNETPPRADPGWEWTGLGMVPMGEGGRDPESG
jgi:hypothetical protein